MRISGVRGLVVAAVCAASLIGGLARPERASAEEIPGAEVIVEKSTIIDPAYGGVIGSYTYDAAEDEYYVCVYGTSQGLRKIWRTSPGAPWQSDTYVGETFATYPSDMMRFARATDIPNGDTNADLRAFSMMAGMLLNPAPVTRTLPAPANYPLTGGAYGDVDVDGNITISYGAGELAYIVDGGYLKTGPGYSDPDDFDNTKNIFTWDLREIGAATTEQLDYDTGKSGATDGSGNLVSDQNPGGIFGGYNQTDWNDALQVVMSEAAMRDAYTAYRSANPQYGMPELPANESVDNFGRQFTWSTDGASIYAVDKGYDIGGIYKINASTGDTEMIHVEMSNDMYAEPTVVATSTLDFGAGAGTGDQVVVNGTAYTGNVSGLTYVVHDGTSTSSAKTLLHGSRMQTQMGEEGVDNLNYLTSDSAGNIYFWSSGAAAMFRRDPQGRVSKVVSKAEAYEIAYEHDGKRSNGGGFLRLQTREDVDGTHVTFRGDNSFIGVVHIHDPADLNKDGNADQADRDLFIAQRRTTMLGSLPAAGDAGYTDYLAADLNGDLVVNDAGEITQGSVDQMDELLLFQYLNQQPGDLNLDGEVTAVEQSIVQNNIGVSGSWFQGDFNRDGIVTQADVDMVSVGTYDITNVEPTAAYVGGATGTWADVQKPSTAAADADSLITLARDGGATIAGNAGKTLAGQVVIGSSNETHTGTTSLELAADSTLESALGVVVTGKGELDGSATGAGVKLGIPGYGGTLVVEDGGTLSGAFTVQGSLQIANSTAKSLDAVVTDTDTTSSLTKYGAGALTVNSANTYTGETRIAGGSLIVGNDDAIPAVSVLYIGPDATLDLNGHDVTIGGLDSDDSDFSVPQILLGSNTLTYDSEESGWHDGDISGTGSLEKKGAGQLTLAAQTSFTGGVTVDEGTLRIYEDDALATTNAVTVNAGGTFGLYRSDQEVAEINGNGIIANTYDGSSSSSSSYNTTLTLNIADATGDPNVDNSFAGSIADDSGSADVARMAVVKTGAGTLELTGVNTFERGLTVSQGVLQAPSEQSIGSGPVDIAAGAELRVAGNVLNRPVTGVAGSKLTATGTLLVGDATSTDGYSFGGDLYVNSHSVGLVDANAAELHGALLDGGALSSFNGIDVVADAWIYGNGTVNGAVTGGAPGSNDAFIWGESASDVVVLTGIVNGNCNLNNVQMDGVYRSGFSPAFTLVGGQSSFVHIEIEIEGMVSGSYDHGTDTKVIGDYDQFYVYGVEAGDSGYTGLELNGLLEIVLEGYNPVLGDEFVLFQVGPYSKTLPFGGGTVDYGPGVIVYGTGFNVDFSGAMLDPGLSWDYVATDSGLTLTVVPEPASMALLALGGMAAVLHRRRRR
jgi:autotransporter-associated beta strand protein